MRLRTGGTGWHHRSGFPMAVSDGHVAAGAVIVEGGARRVHGIGRVATLL